MISKERDLIMRMNVTSAWPLKAVIFDCDGVLVDTEPLHYHAFQEVLTPLGLAHTFEHYLEHYIGFDDRDAFLEAFREGGRTLDEATLTQLIRTKEKALRVIIRDGISSFPGVVTLVRELAARSIPLAVASGALRHEVETFVGVLGLTGLFSVIVAADDVSKSKPDPETYLKVLERLCRLGVLEASQAPRCVAIEDTPAGIQAAKGAGMYVLGVTNSFPADKLESANHVVRSLEELDVDSLVRWFDQAP
jgi:beta-phosphoglucomutase